MEKYYIEFVGSWGVYGRVEIFAQNTDTAEKMMKRIAGEDAYYHDHTTRVIKASEADIDND